MNQVREHWGSKVGFLFAAIGSAIGLGILWKFPYTVGQNGGGLFLIAYFVCLVIVGLPLLIGELILGRGSERAAVGAFMTLHKESTPWKLAGWLGVLASFLIMSFYSVIAGWGMSYVLMSLTGFYQGLSRDEVSRAFSALSHSGGISLFWHLVFTVVTMGIVFAGVRKGIEFWTKLMTRVFLVLMVCLFLFSVTLPGFGDACDFLFSLNVEKFQFSSAIEALGLAFWTLSIGQGIMISYGSYMRHQEDVLQLAGIVAFSVVVVAVLAGLTIFPIVFSFDVPPNSGAGLVFQTLPYLFAQLPGSLVISTIFFALFVFTALTSAIPLIEVVATNIMELHNISRKQAVLLTGAGTFILGIPSAFAYSGGIFPEWQEIYGMNFLDTVNTLVSIWIIPIGGVLTSLFLGWRLDKAIAFKEFSSGTRFGALFSVWYFFIRYVVPLTILVIIIQKSGLFNFDRIFS